MKLLLHLSSELTFTGTRLLFTADADEGVFLDPTIENLTSSISHWKLSLQYLRCSKYFNLTLRQSEQLFSTLLNFPILKELDIQSEIMGQFFCIPQHLQSLTLSCPGHDCDALRYLKDNQLHSIKSLKLIIRHYFHNVDEAIGEYLQTDTSLEELTLDFTPFNSSLSHLVQGLQVNTCLTKLTISPRNYSLGSHNDLGMVHYDLGMLELAQMFQLNTTLQFIELWVDMRLPMELLPVLEALRENNTVKHLALRLYVPQLHTSSKIPKRTPYTVTTEEAEAVGNVLAKNKTLEVFHIIAEITECSPIVKGLLKNKTLKEFGTFEKTKKNIITYPEYLDVRQRIVFVDDLYINDYV